MCCAKKDYDVLATLKNVLLEECTFNLSTDNYFVLTSGKEELQRFTQDFMVESSRLN